MLTKSNNRLILTDTSYSVGKKLVQVILPAFSAMYFGLATIWGLPAAEQVVGTTAIITTFLGVSLGISSIQYDASGAAYDGSLVVKKGENGRKIFSLELNGDPEEVVNKTSITFKIDPHDIEEDPTE